MTVKWSFFNGTSPLPSRRPPTALCMPPLHALGDLAPAGPRCGKTYQACQRMYVCIQHVRMCMYIYTHIHTNGIAISK